MADEVLDESELMALKNTLQKDFQINEDEIDETYLTIEIGVKPKPYCNVVKNMLHCNDHILVVCYKENWCDLKYVKSRKSIHDEK